MIYIYFDGGCEPINPKGVATYGFVIYQDERKLMEDGGLAGKPFTEQTSNNVAEYTGIIKSLEYLIKHNFTNEKVVVKGDSKLIINQMRGEYRVKATRLIPLFKKADELRRKFKDISFEWMPREENMEADVIVRKQYELYMFNHPELSSKLDRALASDKQKELMDELDIFYDGHISKREASKLISKQLRVEKCLKKLDELDNIGKPVSPTPKGEEEEEVMGEIEDLVFHIVGENRYEIQRIKLKDGGIAYRLCYYTCDANYKKIFYGGKCPILNSSAFIILMNEAKKKGWL